MPFEIVSKSSYPFPGAVELSEEQAAWFADALSGRAEIFRTEKVRIDPRQQSLFADGECPGGGKACKPEGFGALVKKTRAKAKAKVTNAVKAAEGPKEPARVIDDAAIDRLIDLLAASSSPMSAVDIAADLAWPKDQIRALLATAGCTLQFGKALGTTYGLDRTHPRVLGRIPLPSGADPADIAAEVAAD